MISILDSIPKENQLDNIIHSSKFNIYIVHYDKLVERKQNVINQLELNKFDKNSYEFITEYKRTNLLNSDIFLFDLKKVNLASVSITLSHLKAYIKLLDSNDNFCLILEDDVFLDTNFKEKLEKYITQIPDDLDMLFIGDGCNFHIPNEIIQLNPGKNIFLKSNYPTTWGGDGATRCVDSYLVSRKCALKILKYLTEMETKIDHNIDWWLNDVIRKLNLNIYWSEPTIVTQGTQNGVYTTSH